MFETPLRIFNSRSTQLLLKVNTQYRESSLPYLKRNLAPAGIYHERYISIFAETDIYSTAQMDGYICSISELCLLSPPVWLSDLWVEFCGLDGVPTKYTPRNTHTCGNRISPTQLQPQQHTCTNWADRKRSQLPKDFFCRAGGCVRYCLLWSPLRCDLSFTDDVLWW